MATVVTINGTDRSTSVLVGTLSVEERLGARTICSFEIQDDSYRPTILHPVTVTVDGLTLFAGVVSDIEGTTAIDNKSLKYNLTATDYSFYADRAIATWTWSSGLTLKQLVTDIVAKWLTQFGVTVSASQADGPTFGEVKAEWITVTELLNYVTKLSSSISPYTPWVWTWSTTNVLSFATPQSTSTPATLTVNNVWPDLKWRIDTSHYRNRQYILFQNASDAVSYVDTQQTSQYGEWQAFAATPDIDNSTDAINLARGLVDRYGFMPKIITATTSLFGFHKGQSGSITIGPMNINSEPITIQAATYRHTPRIAGLKNYPASADVSSWVTEIEAVSAHNDGLGRGGLNRQGGFDWMTEWEDLLYGSGGTSAGGASGSVISPPATPISVVSSEFHAYLGGSRTNEVQHTTAVPVPDYVDVSLDSTRFANTIYANIDICTTNAGTAVTPRVVCVDAGNQVVGAGYPTTSTYWTRQAFALSLVTGVHTYRLELVPSNGTYGVRAIGYVSSAVGYGSSSQPASAPIETTASDEVAASDRRLTSPMSLVVSDRAAVIDSSQTNRISMRVSDRGGISDGGGVSRSGTALGLDRSTVSDAGTSLLLSGGTKALLQWSDFTFLGMYQCDVNAFSNPYGADFGYVSGLTHRYVGAEAYPRFYVCNYQTGALVEIQPTGAPAAPAPATMTTLGHIAPIGIDPTGRGATAQGLHWVEAEKRLYYGMDVSGWYDSYDGPKWGYAKLSDTTPSVMSHDASDDIWAISSYTQAMPNQPTTYGQRWLWGCTSIPAWFAAAYTGGRTLAAGFGGARSQTATGPTHHGVAMFATHPIDRTRDRTTAYNLGGWAYAGGLVPLVGAPYSHMPTMNKEHLGVDFYEGSYVGTQNTYNKIHGAEGFGSGCWIDLPTKHGFLITTCDLEDNLNWMSGTSPLGTVHLNGDHAIGSTTLHILEGGCTNNVNTTRRGVKPDDVLFVHTDFSRPGGNGAFGDPPYVGAPGAPGPWGEMVIVTGIVDDTTITVRHTDRDCTNYGNVGLSGFGISGAAVTMGCQYFDANVPQGRRVPTMYCYDPASFAAVTQGASWTGVQWAWAVDNSQGLQPYVDRAGRGGNWMIPQGHFVDMTFDERTNRLYCLRPYGMISNTITHPWWGDKWQIFVFQVA